MHTYDLEPSFCFIAPISLLEFTKLSTSHLVLAHLVSESQEYAGFYKERSAQGDFVMMDNSAYELKEPYSPDKLLELAGRCGAHAIVLPDYPFQEAQVTIDAANKFAPIFKAAGYKTFFVPQSKKGDKEDWISSYEWASTNDAIDIIGMSILGIPNAIPHIDPTFARVVMTEKLMQLGVFNHNKHHHYLGLNGGPRTEIPSLLRMNALDTIDSSGPIWSAVLGHEYTNNADSLLMVKKPKMPVDFHIEVKDTVTHRRILHNIEMTKNLFLDTEDEVWYAQE